MGMDLKKLRVKFSHFTFRIYFNNKMQYCIIQTEGWNGGGADGIDSIVIHMFILTIEFSFI